MTKISLMAAATRISSEVSRISRKTSTYLPTHTNPDPSSSHLLVFSCFLEGLLRVGNVMPDMDELNEDQGRRRTVEYVLSLVTSAMDGVEEVLVPVVLALAIVTMDGVEEVLAMVPVVAALVMSMGRVEGAPAASMSCCYPEVHKKKNRTK